MDLLIQYPLLAEWLLQYGGVALFFLLVLGIIALPVPEETLMVVAGLLMSQGSLYIPSTIFFTYAGSMCGITVSYIIGRTAGYYLVTHWGSRIGITEARFKQAEAWFDKFGKWSLPIGYFIPGLRHFTGLSCGITKMEFKSFALFAYVGAVLWVSTFLAVGYFCGDYCFAVFKKFELGIWEIVGIGLTIFMVYLSFKIFKKYRISENLISK